MLTNFVIIKVLPLLKLQKKKTLQLNYRYYPNFTEALTVCEVKMS